MPKSFQHHEFRSSNQRVQSLADFRGRLRITLAIDQQRRTTDGRRLFGQILRNHAVKDRPQRAGITVICAPYSPAQRSNCDSGSRCLAVPNSVCRNERPARCIDVCRRGIPALATKTIPVSISGCRAASCNPTRPPKLCPTHMKRCAGSDFIHPAT